MTGQDSFERDLGRAMEPRPAPAQLQRRIASIPLDHPRRRATSWVQRWLGEATLPWTIGATAAVASLMLGLWIGGVGLAGTDDNGNDELAALMFPSSQSMLGDEL